MHSTAIGLHSSDLDAIKVLQAEEPSLQVWVFDPSLYGRFKARDVQNLRLILCEEPLDLTHCLADSHDRVQQIQQQLRLLFDKDFAGAWAHEWQYTNLLQQMTYLYSYGRLWERILQLELPSRPRVLLNDVPGFFSSTSYWPSLLLSEQLRRRGVEFTAYSFGQIDYSIYLPLELTVGWDAQACPSALVHLPTCFYDGAVFGADIAARHPDALNLQSGIWDVEFPGIRNARSITPDQAYWRLEAAERQSIDAAVAGAEQVFLRTFSPYTLSESHVQRQARHLAGLLQAQLVLYLWLMRPERQACPQRLVLSNHCAGLHGPLLSYARQRAIEVLMLPHSKFFNWPVTSAGTKVTACPHPLQGIPVRDTKGAPVTNVPLDFKESHAYTYRVTGERFRVGIILNEVGGKDCLYLPIGEYLQGLRLLTQWLQSRGVDYQFRTRPSCQCIEWLVDEVGIAVDRFHDVPGSSIADFARDCDFCVMYDIPTSGAIDLLKSACPLVNVITRPLHDIEAGLAHTDIIPRESVTQCLERMDDFVANPSSLERFRRTQFAAYERAFTQASQLQDLLRLPPARTQP